MHALQRIATLLEPKHGRARDIWLVRRAVQVCYWKPFWMRLGGGYRRRIKSGLVSPPCSLRPRWSRSGSVGIAQALLFSSPNPS